MHSVTQGIGDMEARPALMVGTGAWGHGVPAEARRPALACIGGTECRPKAGIGLHWGHWGTECPAVGWHWPAALGLGARSAGIGGTQCPAEGPGRRPALRSPFGHCMHAVDYNNYC